MWIIIEIQVFLKMLFLINYPLNIFVGDESLCFRYLPYCKVQVESIQMSPLELRVYWKEIQNNSKLRFAPSKRDLYIFCILKKSINVKKRRNVTCPWIWLSYFGRLSPAKSLAGLFYSTVILNLQLNKITADQKIFNVPSSMTTYENTNLHNILLLWWWIFESQSSLYLQTSAHPRRQLNLICSRIH